MSVYVFSILLKLTSKSPPKTASFIGLSFIKPDSKAAIAEAVAPVPHANVSSSTPLS